MCESVRTCVGWPESYSSFWRNWLMKARRYSTSLPYSGPQARSQGRQSGDSGSWCRCLRHQAVSDPRVVAHVRAAMRRSHIAIIHPDRNRSAACGILSRVRNWYRTAAQLLSVLGQDLANELRNQTVSLRSWVSDASSLAVCSNRVLRAFSLSDSRPPSSKPELAVSNHRQRRLRA